MSNDEKSNEQDADSYYGEEDMAADDLDLSFLDEEADEDKGQEKVH